MKIRYLKRQQNDLPCYDCCIVIFSHDLLYQLCNLIPNRNDLSDRPNSIHKASAAEATLNTLTQAEKGQFFPFCLPLSFISMALLYIVVQREEGGFIIHNSFLAWHIIALSHIHPIFKWAPFSQCRRVSAEGLQSIKTHAAATSHSAAISQTLASRAGTGCPFIHPTREEECATFPFIIPSRWVCEHTLPHTNSNI